MALTFYKSLIAGVALLFSHREEPVPLLINHPIYLSVTEISYNAKDKIVAISCKIFTDDLQQVLTKSSGSKIDLINQNNKATTNKLIAAYIIKHLQLQIDNKPVAMQFVGSEKEEDVMWSYFRIDNIPAIKKLDITNDILYETFDSEINLVHVMVDGNRQSKKLNNPEAHATFEF